MDGNSAIVTCNRRADHSAWHLCRPAECNSIKDKQRGRGTDRALSIQGQMSPAFRRGMAARSIETETISNPRADRRIDESYLFAGHRSTKGVAMRIAYLTQSYPPMVSGAAIFGERLAKEMTKRGHQVLVI